MIQRRQEKGDMGCPVKYLLHKYDHMEEQGVVRMPVTTAPRMWPQGVLARQPSQMASPEFSERPHLKRQGKEQE